jgi:cytochrome c peroxidase
LWIVTILVMACHHVERDADPTSRAAAIAALGRMLFFDPVLSADGLISCARCHQPERAYTDGRRLAAGAGGRVGTRNAPSLLDVGRQRSLFWDGRRARLEDQALDPLLNEVEHGLTDETQLLAKLRANPRTVAAFGAAFGEPVARSAQMTASDAHLVTAAHTAEALAAFERTLVSQASPFDRFLAGNKGAMPAAARRGWVVFDQQAHCTRCHVATANDGERPLFTDHRFHSLTVGFAKVERKRKVQS